MRVRVWERRRAARSEKSKNEISFVLLLLSFFGVLPVLALAVDLPSVAEKQDWPAVGTQLSAKADPNSTQPDGTTALHWAAYHDKADIVAQLLASGAKADPVNRYGITPLLLACQNGNEGIVRALLKAGVNVNASQRGGETALMIAARTGKPGVLNALLEKGAKIDAQDRKGQTAVMWAAAEGHAAAIDVLVKAGADFRAPLKSGFTPLLFAAREGRIEAVHALLKAGVDVNEAIVTDDKIGGRDAPNGTSALVFAVENGHFELAMALVKAGANPNDMRSGFTPLHTLAHVRKPPRGDGESGQPPPETTGKLSSLDFIREIIAAGADVNAALTDGAPQHGNIDFEGATPFLFACISADLPMMKLLIELGADPRKPNKKGTTPLMAAAGLATLAPDEEPGTEDECIAAVEHLLSLGADVNAVDQDGQTAMHGAAFKSLPKMVKLLATKGAKIEVWNRKNKNGWTPLLIAQGFRKGNFKPSAETTAAISDIMLAAGVQPPPPPDRDSLPKKKGYQP